MTKKDGKTMQNAAEDYSKTLILRRLPKSVHNAVAKRAIDQDTTQQVVVLRALKDAGIPVEDALLIPGRRRKPVQS